MGVELQRQRKRRLSLAGYDVEVNEKIHVCVPALPAYNALSTIQGGRRSSSIGVMDRRSASLTVPVEVDRDDHGVGHMGAPSELAVPNDQEENPLISEYHYVVVSCTVHSSYNRP